MSTGQRRHTVPRADLLDVTDHAVQKYQERVDAEDPYPEETIRQIIAHIQRCASAAPPDTPDGLVVVVDWQSSCVVTVYTTDRVNPRVVRA